MPRTLGAKGRLETQPTATKEKKKWRKPCIAVPSLQHVNNRALLLSLESTYVKVSVSSVHADAAHTSIEQLDEFVDSVRSGANRANDAGLGAEARSSFHLGLLGSCRAKKRVSIRQQRLKHRQIRSPRPCPDLADLERPPFLCM